MKRLLGLIGTCALGGLLLVAMVTWLDYQAVRAQTPPPGCETIDSDISSPTEVWNLARAPCYRVVTSTVAIQKDAWLTIEAGVEVYFDSGSRLQISSDGGLTAIGTDSAPIMFTSAVTTGQENRCDWSGIIINSDVGPPVHIQHAVIEYACVGLDPGGRRGLTITHNIFRYNGNGTASGAIVGDTDNSVISHNTVYSCQNGIILNEAGDNKLRNNTIYDINQDGIAFVRGGVVGGERNSIVSNTIHHCGGNGILLEESDNNTIFSNTIYSCNENGVRLENGNNNTVFSNTIYNTMLTSTNPGGAVHLLDQIGTSVQHNHIYNNGGGSGYQASLYVTGTNSIIGDISYNVIYDTITDTVEFAPDTTPLSNRPMAYNALCSIPIPGLELRNNTGANVTAPHNWWGVNTPTLGVNYTGSVDPNPPIILSLNGDANGAVTVWLRDSAGSTVPPPPTRQTIPPAPNAREIELSTNWGTFNLDTVEVNNQGNATTTWNPGVPPAPDTIVITATGFCNYSVIDTIPLPDLIITKTAAVAQVPLGGLLDYTIDYCNVGDETAENVEITDILPLGTTYVSNDSGFPCAGCSGNGPLVLDVGPLPAGACDSFTLRLRVNDDPLLCSQTLINTVQITTTTLERDTTNNENIASVVVVGPDVTIVKTAATPQVVRGGLLNYTITYYNDGDGAAANVSITDTLPPGTTYVSDSSGLACVDGSTGLPCAPGSTGPLIWTVAGDLLPAPPTHSFGLVLRVNDDPALCGNILVNTIRIGTTTSECDNLPNQASASTPVVGPDVTIVKTAATPQVLRSGLLNYAITYYNGGNAAAANVSITDTLPPGTIYVSDSSGLACVDSATGLPCTPGSTGPLIWTVAGDLLPAPPTHSFGLVLRVNDDPTLCGNTLVNTIRIGTPTPECGNLPKQASASTLVVGPDVTITKTTSLIEVVHGNGIPYTITYCNVGNALAENVVITDNLPAGTSYESSSLPCPACIPGSPGPLVWGTGALPLGDCDHVTLTLQVDSSTPPSTTLTNTVSIATTTPECGAGRNNNETDSPPVHVIGTVDLVVLKGDAVGSTSSSRKRTAWNRWLRKSRGYAPLAIPPGHRDFVFEGDLVTYTIFIDNCGVYTATNVVLTETLPLHTTYVGYGWQRVGATRQYTMPLPDLPPEKGGVCSGAIADFVVQIEEPLPAPVNNLTNTVCGWSDELDIDPDNNCSLIDTPVRRRLLLTKTAAVPQVVAGEIITFVIEYSDPNNLDFTGVRITDTPPPGTRWHSDTAATLGWTRVQTTPQVAWYTPTLAAGAQGSFVLSLAVALTGTCDVTLTNQVALSVLNAGKDYFVVSDTVEFAVSCPVDLVVVKTDNVDPLTSRNRSLNPDKRAILNRFLWEPQRYGPLAASQHREFVLEGDLVTYTILIVNASPYTATNVVLSETLPLHTQYVGIGWTHVAGRTFTQTVGTLPAGHGRRYYFVVRVDDPLLFPVDNLTNTVCGWGDEVDPHLEDNCDHEDTPVHTPSLTIAKTADTTLSKIGHDIIYNITVCNTGDVALIKQGVTDTLISGVNPVFGPALDPGACESHDFPRTVQIGDLDPLINLATARYHVDGRPDRSLVATNTHEVNLFQPGVEVEKGNIGPALSKIGDPITYTFRITNTSSADTPALNLESIIDTLLGDLTAEARANGCDPLPTTNDSCSFTVTYTVQPGDPDPLPNTVTVLYHPNGFLNNITDADDHEVNLFQPDVAVEKSGDALSKIGDGVIYHFWITNTSSLDSPALNLESVVDTLLGDLTAEARANGCDLLPITGDSCHFTLPYTIPAGAPDPLPNAVTVLYHLNGFPNDVTDTDDHAVNLFQPGVAVEKGGDTLSKIGDEVIYHFWITNTSSADSPDLLLDSVTDMGVSWPGLGDLIASIPVDCTRLAPGAACHFTQNYTVLAGDPDPLRNTVTVHYHPEGFPNDITDTDDHEVNLFQPGVVVEKGGDTLSKIGDEVIYHFWITNTSSLDSPDLLLDSVTDVGVGWPGLGDLTASAPADCTRLAPGAACHFTQNYTVLAGNPDPLRNTVTVHYHPEGFPNDIIDSDDHEVNLFQPGVAVEKGGDTLSKIGDEVIYHFWITNTSSSDTPVLNLASVIDTLLGDITAEALANGCDSLPTGNSCHFTVAYIVQAGDPDPLPNTVTVLYHPLGFLNDVTDTDDHSVNLFQPAVEVEKGGDTLSKIGDEVIYHFWITNTSSLDTPMLNLESVVDTHLGDLTAEARANGCDPLPTTGDSCHFTVLYTVQPGDPDPLPNTVTVLYHPNGFPNAVTDADDHSVNLFQPTVAVEKGGDTLSKIGDEVTYHFWITNTSSADSPDLILDSITDVGAGWPGLGDLTASAPAACARLAPGAACHFIHTRTAITGDPDPLRNTVTVHYHPEGFTNDITASDDHEVNLFQPRVEVKKTGPESAYVDNTITYTFRIINTGSADSPDLILDSVTDVGDGWPGLGDLTGIARANGCDPLLPGNSCSFDVLYTIQPGDPDPLTNLLTNTVTVNFHPTGFTNVITHSDFHTVATSIDVDLVVTKNDDVGPTTPTNARLAADKQAAVDRLLRAAQRRASLAPAQLQREFVGPGDLITFTIVVINMGQSTAANVIITETLPLYTTYVGYGWQQVGATRDYIMSLPNLPSQVGRVITFVVRIDDPLPPEVRSIINYVCSFGSAPDRDDTDNCRYTDAPVLNLGLDKEADPSSILPGEQVTFTITLSNPSQFTGSITITDGLPDGFTWITDTAETVGLTRVLTYPVVVWHTPAFTAGEHVSFTLTAQASLVITCGRWVTNVVTATVRVGDQAYDWTATAGVWLQCYIDLLVTKDDDVGPITPMNVSLTPDKQAIVDRVQREARANAPMAPAQQHREFVRAGDLITYTITIANVGAYTITNAVLSETIPLYTTYVGYGWTNLGGRTYITTVGTLPPGIGHVYFLVVRVDDPLPFGVNNLINHVCGWGDDPDEYIENNCNYEDTPVRADGKLYVANRGENPDDPDNSGALDVFDTSFDHIRTIGGVGRDPWGMAAYGGYLYAGDFNEDGQSGLYVIDTDSDTVVHSLTLGSPGQSATPVHMAVLTSSGTVSLYVTSHSGPPAITVIDVTPGPNGEPPSWNILDEIALNRPATYEFGFFGAATDTRRRCVYFTKRDFGGVGIWRLCPPSDTLEYVYPTDEGANEKPFSILYNPDDDLVYVAFALLAEVWIFDPDGFQLLDRVPTEVQDPAVHTGHGGQGLAASGQYVFVSNYISESVTVITNGSRVEQARTGLAVSQAAGFNHRIYVPMVLKNFSGQPDPPIQPAQIDTATIRWNDEYENGQPKGMTTAHNLLFVTLPHEDIVLVIDTETLTVTHEIAIPGDHPHSVILVESD